MSLKIVVKYIIAFQTILCFAQQDTLLVKPSTNYIDGTLIKPYTNKWKVTYITADGKEVPNKIWTDNGQIIKLNHQELFYRIQCIYDPNMELLDTWINLVEHKTLIPKHFSTLNSNGGFSYFDFKNNVVNGSTNLNPSKKTNIINTEFEELAFDWNLYGMLLVGLPLEKNLIAKMPIYNIQNKKTEWLIVQVIAQDHLIYGTEQIEIATYKILTNKNLTFWISKNAPYVIKLELELQDSAKLVWEITD